MKKIIIFCLLPFLLLGYLNTVNAEETLAVNSKSAILIDEASGDILFEKNIHDRLIPASMTKIMSMILLCDKLAKNDISLDDKVKVSANAAGMGGSQVYLKENEVFSIHELLKCVAIVSANDACVALSEHLYGSEAEFVKQMNLKAQALGLEDTNFKDCTGLTDKGHYSSAYDMAMMSKYLLNNYKHIIIPYTSTYEDYIRQDTDNPFWLVATNKLVKHVEGIDGLKTGYISTGGYCISTTMKKGNMRLISVVMGYKTSLLRNKETVELLNYGFANYEHEMLIEKDAVIEKKSSILYKPEKFNIILDEDVSILKHKNEESKELRYEILEEPTYKNEYGSIKVYYDNEEVGIYKIKFDCKVTKRTYLEVMYELFKMMIN